MNNLGGKSGRARLAIISTYDELCGIAGYTKALMPHLEPNFDIKVFDLDQNRLRSRNRRVERVADLYVKEIARQLREFDFVNIQLEYGTLGSMPRQILRRFAWLVDAAPALSVTFHTIARPARFNMSELLDQSLRGGFRDAIRLIRNHRQQKKFVYVYRKLKRAQATKPVRLIVHTRRDRQFIEDAFGFSDVHDHPLAYNSAEQVAEVRARASRLNFPAIDALPPGTKLVGTFGFLSSYKGVETAIQAVKRLPPEYHLLIFGGVHPTGIAEFRQVDHYTGSLLKAAQQGGRGADRIHFLGVPTDDEFVAGMAICDVVVLPYIEVGQTSSASMSQAVELGCRVLAARNHAFTEFGRYHPDAVEYFDIGNYLELASRIQARPSIDRYKRTIRYDASTNAELYRRVHSLP